MTCSVLWGIYFWQFTEKWFGKKFNYLYEDNVQNNTNYRAYTRNDRSKWNKKKFYLVGFFTLPIRLISIILLIAVTNFIGRLTKFCLGLKNLQDFTDPKQKTFDKIFKKVMQFNTRLILFICGFFWNPIKKVQFNEQKYPKLKASKEKRAQIIISNHVNPLDPYVINYLFQCSFVSKDSVKSYPLVGPISEFNKTLYVNRGNKKDRQQVFDDIRQRVQQIREYPNIPQLAIFPEAGTTNGKGIIDFRKGAFVHQASLRIVGLKYIGSEFSLGFTLLGTLDYAIGVLCNTSNKVEIQVLDTLIEKKDSSITDEDYMKEIKKMMCEEMGFENIKGYFFERKQFENPYIGENCE